MSASLNAQTRAVRPGPRSPLPTPGVFLCVTALGLLCCWSRPEPARFSEAFLVLRAQDVGLGLSYVPIVMIVMNLLYAGAAYPAGAAADRVSSRTLLFLGLVLLFIADVVLAFAASPLIVLAGAALWGLHMAFTQGLLSKIVADTAPKEMVGTGFGIFNLVSGAALLLASIIGGTLWSSFGAPATFIAGAGFAAVAAIGLTISARSHGTPSVK